MDELVFNLELKLDEANRKIDILLSNTEKKAKNSGDKAGRAFGKQFASIVGGIIAKISFDKIVNQSNKAIQAYRNLQSSNIVLRSAVDAINKTGLEQNSILQSTTASLEEKGRALGYSTSQLYEEVKATGGASKANFQLEKDIKLAEYALEDQTNAIEEQISALNANISALDKKSKQEVQAIRNAKGYGDLTDEQYSLQKELNDLEIQKLEATKAGDTFAALFAENLIKAKRVDLNLTDEKIKKIDLETKKVEESYKTQIDALKEQAAVFRQEISAQKNKFDLDIEPARRKLEELKDLASQNSGGGGTTKAFKPAILQEIEDAAKNPFEELSMSDVEKAVNTFYKDFNGVVGRSTVVQGFSDLLRAGVGDVEDISTVMKGFIDIASAGKTPFISMDAAVAQLTQQFRTQNAQLGESAGLTEEYLTPGTGIIARGLESLQSQGILIGKNARELTDEQKAMAAREGLVPIMAMSQDVFNEKLNSGALATEEFAARTRELQEAIGEGLAPVQVAFFEAITPLILILTQFAKDNPQIVVAFVLIAGAITSIIGAVLLLSPLVGSLVTLFAGKAGVGLGASILAMAGPIGWIVLALVGIGTALVILYQKSETFRDKINSSFEFVKNAVEGLKDNFWLNIGRIIGFFANLPVKLLFWVAQALWGIKQAVANFDWAGVWKAMIDYFNSDKFGEDLKKAFQAIRDLLQGFLEGLFKGTPFEGKINLFSKGGGSFKEGGYTGSGGENELAGVVHKNEAVLNPKQMAGLIHALSKLGNSTQTFQQNIYGGGSNVGFPVPYRIT